MPSTIPWWANSLLSTALAIVVAGVAVWFDRRKTVNQELIRKRIAVYDQVAPKLNDILCFFLCVGRFKELPPPMMIAHKRELDRTMNVYEPVFSPVLKAYYDRFVKACFITYAGGIGRPALIAADTRQLEPEWGADWQASWTQGFVPCAKAAESTTVFELYHALMDQFAVELGAGRRSPAWRGRLKRALTKRTG